MTEEGGYALLRGSYNYQGIWSNKRVSIGSFVMSVPQACTAVDAVLALLPRMLNAQLPDFQLHPPASNKNFLCKMCKFYMAVWSLNARFWTFSWPPLNSAGRFDPRKYPRLFTGRFLMCSMMCANLHGRFLKCSSRNPHI